MASVNSFTATNVPASNASEKPVCAFPSPLALGISLALWMVIIALGFTVFDLISGAMR